MNLSQESRNLVIRRVISKFYFFLYLLSLSKKPAPKNLNTAFFPRLFFFVKISSTPTN